MSPNAWFKIKSSANEKIKQESGTAANHSPKKTQREIINIKGKITDINFKYRQAMLLDESGKKYLLVFSENDAIPEKGREFSGQVYVEDFSDSVYIAVVRNIF